MIEVDVEVAEGLNDPEAVPQAVGAEAQGDVGHPLSAEAVRLVASCVPEPVITVPVDGLV